MSLIDKIKQIPIVEVVSAFFPSVELKKDGRNFAVLCPFHSEKTPSFKIDPEKNRWRCFGSGDCGGGSAIDLIIKAELASKPLEAAKIIAKKFGIKEDLKRRRNLPALKPLTIQSYAKYLDLPAGFLTETFRLEDTPDGITIPYLDEFGNKVGTQMRHRLEKTKSKDNRFSWKKEKDSKTYLYGAWALPKWAEKKLARVAVVEGASDVHVSWYSKIPALGVPGATALKKNWAKLLLQFEEIAIIKEPDEAG